MLQSMGSQRVGHDLVNEQQQLHSELEIKGPLSIKAEQELNISTYPNFQSH